MIFDKEDYKAFDPELWNAIDAEAERQQNNIELIASENVVSKAVMAAQGTLLTNKYAEGYQLNIVLLTFSLSINGIPKFRVKCFVIFFIKNHRGLL